MGGRHLMVAISAVFPSASGVSMATPLVQQGFHLGGAVGGGGRAQFGGRIGGGKLARREGRCCRRRGEGRGAVRAHDDDGFIRCRRGTGGGGGGGDADRGNRRGRKASWALAAIVTVQPAAGRQRLRDRWTPAACGATAAAPGVAVGRGDGGLTLAVDAAWGAVTSAPAAAAKLGRPWVVDEQAVVPATPAARQPAGLPPGRRCTGKTSCRRRLAGHGVPAPERPHDRTRAPPRRSAPPRPGCRPYRSDRERRDDQIMRPTSTPASACLNLSRA